MIWIIGANGMLGSQLCSTLSENKIDFVGTDRDVDITDFASLKDFAGGKNITAIVNCAAYTAVDNAESDVELAQKLNADGPRNIARLAKTLGVPFIHISTDYVFGSTSASLSNHTSACFDTALQPLLSDQTPYTEDMPVTPLGVYGKTKSDGEKAVQEETEDFYILRTAWLYGFNGKNFVYTMIRAMNARDSVKVVSDQRGTPTNCITLAGVILKIIQNREEILKQVQNDAVVERSRNHTFAPFGGQKIPNGIYHVTDEGETTWFDFTNEIKKQAAAKGLLTNEKCVANPCTTDDYPTPVKRPAYSVLSKKKIQQTLGITLPPWQESLSDFINSPLFDKARIF